MRVKARLLLPRGGSLKTPVVDQENSAEYELNWKQRELSLGLVDYLFFITYSYVRPLMIFKYE